MTVRMVSHASFVFLLSCLLTGCKGTTEPEQAVTKSGSTIIGHVIDQATSRPVAYARVGLNSTARLKNALSSTDGGFVFTGVTPGSYRITVNRAEYGPVDVEVPQGVRDTSLLTVSVVRKTTVPMVGAHRGHPGHERQRV